MARTSAVLNVSDLNGANGFRIDGAPIGSNVAGLGDVNGDGYDDILVGQSLTSSASQAGAYISDGYPYVLFGGSGGFGSAFNLSSVNGSNGFRIDGLSNKRDFGAYGSRAGDINGDGFADVVIVDTYAIPPLPIRRDAYVIYGHAGAFDPNFAESSVDGTNGFRIVSNQGRGQVSGARMIGDFNGDGLSDLIVYADGAAAYVVYGRQGGFRFGSTLDVTTLGGTDALRITSSVSGSGTPIGDINGDGLDDLIFAAPSADPGGRTDAGSAYVLYGRAGGFGSTLDVSSIDGTIGFRIDGASAGDQSGYPISSAGDVNGDGITDFVVAAPGSRGGVGSSYVVFGRSGGFGAVLNLSSIDGSNGFRIDGTVAGAGTGGALAAGDINGDGYGDLLIGAATATSNGLSASGSVYVVYGHSGGFGSALALSSLNGRNGFRIDGALANDRFGYVVSAAGDVNNDGLDDILVGSPYARGGVPYPYNPNGASYVIYGSRNTATAPDDFTGDGTSDLLLQNGGTIADWIMGAGRYQTGNTLGTLPTGTTVVGRGDVNGDGTTDLVLQAGDMIVDWIIGGGHCQSSVTVTKGGADGFAVRAVGDVDANGTDDLVLQRGNTVVAWRLSDGAYAGGRVLGDAGSFTVVGAGDFDRDGDADLLLQSGDTLVAWTLQDGAYQSGRTLPTIAGYRVAGTGDVNGDGTDDIVFQSLSGSGQVVDWIMGAGAFVQSNIVAGDAGGFAVRAVGDYNGDGTADVALQAGTGTVVQWSLRNGLYAGGTVIGNGGGFGVV